MSIYTRANRATDLTRIEGLKKVGSYWEGPCPICGGTDRFQVKETKGGRQLWFCRQCDMEKYGDAVNLYSRLWQVRPREAAKRLLGQAPESDDRPVQTLPPSPERKRRNYLYPWEVWDREEFGRQFQPPDLVERWQAYKPLSRATIRRYTLGYGHLDTHRKGRNYLLMPVWGPGGKIACLKGRDQDGQWRTSTGWRILDLPLGNWEGLMDNMANPTRDVVVVTENYADALWLSQESDTAVGVAVHSTSYWRDSWTDMLAQHQQKTRATIIVALDNDWAGNGPHWSIREEALRLWYEGHEGPPPTPRGPVLTRRLVAAGIPQDRVALFDWKGWPYKADLGDYLRSKMED